MNRIAIDIDNTICNTSSFYGQIAKFYDKNILHKNNIINYDKTVPRSDNWTKEELAYIVIILLMMKFVIVKKHWIKQILR